MLHKFNPKAGAAEEKAGTIPLLSRANDKRGYQYDISESKAELLVLHEEL